MPDFAQRRTMMVDSQVRPSDVTKFPVIEAMLHVPREAFVPPAMREAAYVGENLVFAPGRVLLEPRTFAKIIDGMEIGPADVMLDVGCGLGYSTAVLARIAEFVVGIEDDAGRADAAQAILSQQGVDNAAILAGPLAAGMAKSAPYTAIVIEGAAEIVPDAIVDQLAEGGRIGCLFAEGALGVVRIGHKIDGQLSWRFAFNANAPILPGFERAREFSL